MSSRYYVSLTATCDPEHLHAVLDRMSAVLPTIADAEQLDGLSLSFTRDDGEELLTAGGSLSTALPVAGPVTSTGPGAPPPDAVDTHEASVEALAGQHADPEPQP